MSYLAIGVATVVAFVIGGVYTSVLAGRLKALKPEVYAEESGPQLWKMLVELLRNLVLATVVAGFVSETGIDSWTGGLLLGLAAWVGFPLMLLTGAVVWEKEPWRLAAIHAGDWLLKLLAVAAITGAWS